MRDGGVSLNKVRGGLSGPWQEKREGNQGHISAQSISGSESSRHQGLENARWLGIRSVRGQCGSTYEKERGDRRAGYQGAGCLGRKDGGGHS